MNGVQVLALVQFICLLIVAFSAYMWQRKSYEDGVAEGKFLAVQEERERRIVKISEVLSPNEARRLMGRPELIHKHRYKLVFTGGTPDPDYIKFHCPGCLQFAYLPRWRYELGVMQDPISPFEKAPNGQILTEYMRRPFHQRLQDLKECGHEGPYPIVGSFRMRCTRPKGHEYAFRREDSLHGYAGCFWDKHSNPVSLQY